MQLNKIKENELSGSSNVTAHCAAMQTLHIRPIKKHFSGAIRVRYAQYFNGKEENTFDLTFEIAKSLACPFIE